MRAQRKSAADARAAWYPPVQRTLLCLSRLYRCVEHRVFAGLAQDAVSSCAAAVQARSGAACECHLGRRDRLHERHREAPGCFTKAAVHHRHQNQACA